jgi:hypothetical protein
MSNKPFTKKPGEQYILSIEFVNALPTGSSLSTVEISATDDEGDDITSDVVHSTTGVINGTTVLAYVKGGIDGSRAHIKVRVTLDDEYTVLEENLLMKIEENG